MIIPQHFDDIENLELLAKELVDGFIIGLHQSPYHGFSVEFAEHRLYNTGDNLKHVDWKVYGRKDIMFTKKFEEETNLRCAITIDLSGSMYYPTSGINKLQYSCIASAALMHLLKRQLDAFGIFSFTNQIIYSSPFGSTNTHYKHQLAYLQQLATSKHTQIKTNLSQSLHELAEKIHQRSLIVIFTDIPLNEVNNKSFLDSLLHLKHNKHEILLFHIEDKKLETNFEFDNNLYEFEDMETGNVMRLAPQQIKEQYLEKRNAYKKSIENFCHEHEIDLIHFDLTEHIYKILANYLQKRKKMI